jgi:hypothetical protein
METSRAVTAVLVGCSGDCEALASGVLGTRAGVVAGPLQRWHSVRVGHGDERGDNGAPEVDSETATAYWEHLRLAGSKAREARLAARELNWACEDVTRSIARGGDGALDVLRMLADTAASPAQLELLGAGPLEDLLHEQGEALLDSLDDLIRRTPRLRVALASVWWGEIPDDVATRLRPLADRR